MNAIAGIEEVRGGGGRRPPGSKARDLLRLCAGDRRRADAHGDPPRAEPAGSRLHAAVALARLRTVSQERATGRSIAAASRTSSRKRSTPMQLKPLDSPELLQLVAGWLAQKENYQWLDFGDGRQLVSPEWLKIAMQRGTHVLRVFTADVDDMPIGVVGLSNINTHFKTANFWVVLGDRTHAGQGYASRAASQMLTLGFTRPGPCTRSIPGSSSSNPSVHVARAVNFRPIGRQRQCHYIDGRAYDRLWFDLLASEHEEILMMSDVNALRDRSPALFADALHLDVPSVDTDLFETGVLDSLAFVELLLHSNGNSASRPRSTIWRSRTSDSVAHIAAYVAARTGFEVRRFHGGLNQPLTRRSNHMRVTRRAPLIIAAAVVAAVLLVPPAGVRAQPISPTIDPMLRQVLATAAANHPVEAVVTFSQFPTMLDLAVVRATGVQTVQFRALPMVGVRGIPAQIASLFTLPAFDPSITTASSPTSSTRASLRLAPTA